MWARFIKWTAVCGQIKLVWTHILQELSVIKIINAANVIMQQTKTWKFSHWKYVAATSDIILWPEINIS